MLKAEGKCPRCGKEVEFWYDMISEDDSIFATLYDWHQGNDQIASGFSIKTEDAKCPHCGTELNVDLRVDAFITADSQYEERRVVDWDEEQQLKAKLIRKHSKHIFWRTHFEIDGMCDADGKQMLLEGYTDGQTWNGWACPRFEKAEADRIMEASIAAGFEAKYDEETETYIYAHQDDPTIDEEFSKSFIYIKGESVTVWAIGAWHWIWDEVTDEDIRNRANWQEELDREKAEEDARDVSQEMLLHDLRNDEMERRCDHE